MNSEWDCIVVGAGAAGLSAALVLGRARRRTLVLDSGRQSNLAAAGVGGLLGHDGQPPAELYAAGRRELGSYPSVELRDVEATGGASEGEGFALELADGAVERARAVLLATGMDYSYPDIPGALERWGGSVFHCPFCHGWEVREKELAVIGADEPAFHRALLLRSWSERVTLLSGGAELPADGRERLARAGVELDEREVAGLRGPGRELEAVVFADGSERPCGGLLLPVTLSWRSPLPGQLGARRAAPSPLGTDSIEVDKTGNAGAPGLFAAGDLLSGPLSVSLSVASGSLAAFGVVNLLTKA